MSHPNVNCLVLFMHEIPRARSLALASAGRIMDARIAMIAITTSSSINVKAPNTLLFLEFLVFTI